MKSVIVCFFAVLAIAYSIFAARIDSPSNENPPVGAPPIRPVPGDLDAEGNAWHGGHGGWGGGGWGGGGWGGGGWGGGGWGGGGWGR